MDREIPSVPITTLAGVASLTDLLPEMPLPTPSPQTLSNKSLLFHPRVAEEAQNLLGVRDEILVPQLVHSLVQTSADHIEVKDNYAGNDTKVNQQDSMPELLRAMLDRNPNMFNGSLTAVQPKASAQHWNHTGQPTVQSREFLPPTYDQPSPQDSPAPAAPVMPARPPPTLVNRPSVITEQKPSSSLVMNYNNSHISNNTIQQSDCVSESQPKESTGTADQLRQLRKPSKVTGICPTLASDVPIQQPPTQQPPTKQPPIQQPPIQPPQIQQPPTHQAPIHQAPIHQAPIHQAPIHQPPIQQVPLHQPPVQQPQIQQPQLQQPQIKHPQIQQPQIQQPQPEPVSAPIPVVPSAPVTSEQPVVEVAPPQNHEVERVQTEVVPDVPTQDVQEMPEVAPIPDPIPESKSDPEPPTQAKIKQPIVKLDRLSVEDQQLMQRSLSKFVETRPKLAKELGIVLDKNEKKEITENMKEGEASGSDSEDDQTPNKKKGRKRGHTGSDDDYAPDSFSALVASNKKRKTAPKEEKPEPVVIIKPKLRRVEKKFVPVLEKLSVEELMETNTYLRFNRSIEHVLKSAEDIDASEFAEDGMVQDEYLLSRIVMQELCTEAAKLKILGAMEMIPTDKLVRLLNVLELNIRGGDRVSPITDEDNESIRQMWMETTVERVMGAVDACLVCFYIMTSNNMPKRVYLEEVIDRVVLFVKYHLRNTIFPTFDVTYRVDNNKKKDGRKKKAAPVYQKSILILYTKISELVNLLAELLNIQVLTDTSVLHASSMGVSPFFVENVSELQLACLKLVTTIFTRYESHRRLLLDDILASIARLPSTKRSLRTYRLNSEEHIQMLTALVLQLIQCIVALPDNFTNKNAVDGSQSDNVKVVDKDVLICNKYDKALSTASTFLRVFLNKCGSKSEDIDYRPLFENFVQDLLSTVNKPEWPATEVLLTYLGKMLVNTFSNKGTDMSLRVASLDYLGVVAARLRRDSVLSRCKLDTIDQMIKDIKSEEMKDSDDHKKKKQSTAHTDEERTRFLQRVLLDFLAVNAQNDEGYKYARHFYIAQWYKDTVCEKAQIASGTKETKNNSTRDNHRSKKHDRKKSEDYDEDDEKESSEQDNSEKFKVIEEKKTFLIQKIRPFQETIASGNRIQIFQTYIDYDSAELIAQYLASKRYFSQSFDVYLKSILIVLKETSIAIRTKAMKCLTMIVEADPSVLGRHDMQIGVNHSFLDSSTSVREAAVDLVGKFVLSRPELIDKYYEMLSARILDTGVSVRKRVIKILKDICIECPEFSKIPEICVKMIRRVNDEEGIRKLVMEVFQNMWFTPTKDTPLLRKVMNITDVVASSKDIGLEWFEQLLLSLFKPKEDKDDSTKVQTEPPKVLLLACRQIVDCLIENVLRLEETSDGTGSSQRLVACLTTLYLFAKIRPQLLVKHASTLQPYLGLKCQSAGDIQIISSVARMLELVVPLMEHPSESFLAQLEEDAIKLMLQHDRRIVSSCLSCLGSIINKVTRNYQLIRDCFKRYNEFIVRFKGWLETDHKLAYSTEYRKVFRRALYIVGLLLRHFDFRDPDVIMDLPIDIKDQVYQDMIYFLQRDDSDLQVNALKAIGCICIRHYEFMLEKELKNYYHKLLTAGDAPAEMKSFVLINIESYLVEEENRMIQQDLEWAKRSKEENLKEMGDVSSGMASTVIQLYLKETLQSYLHNDLKVRQAALRVIQLVLQQGLVHPVQIVPYLICMSTDDVKLVSHSADKQLLDIEKKYPGFIHTKSSLGIMLSYQLQKILQDDVIVRGCRVKEPGEYPSSLNGYLYSVLRNSRQQRRALILNILKQFDETVRTSLSYMLYLADNLAYFPYMVQDEPLFIVHHIDIMISVSGTNLLQSFREGLIMTDAQRMTLDSENGNNVANVVSALDEDDDDEEALATRVPEDARQLQAYLTTAQGCLLLLMLKQHIKDIYGLSDGKIQQYSPSEAAKVYEKNITRRSNTLFSPKGTIQKLKEGNPPEYLDEEGRQDLIRQYLDFKQLMLKLDPDDPDDEENAKVLAALSTGNTGTNPPASATTTASILTEADQVALENCKDPPPVPKVPKLVISSRRLDSDTRRTPRAQRTTEKLKKHRHKKKRRKFISSSGDESENDYSDPDFLA